MCDLDPLDAILAFSAPVPEGTFPRNQPVSPIVAVAGSEVAPGLGLGSSRDGFYRDADGIVWVTIDGRKRYRLVDGGNTLRSVGIGTNLTKQVTTTASRLLDSNPDRLGGLIINNTRGQNFYLGFSAAVTPGDVEDVNGGWLVAQNGGSFGLDQLSGYTGELWAITKTGTAISGVAEW